MLSIKHHIWYQNYNGEPFRQPFPLILQIIAIASGVLRSTGMSAVPGVPEDLAQKLGMLGEPDLRILKGFDSFGESEAVHQSLKSSKSGGNGSKFTRVRKK